MNSESLVNEHVKPYVKTIGLVELVALAGSYVASHLLPSTPETLDCAIIAGDYIGCTLGCIAQHYVTNLKRYKDKRRLLKDSLKAAAMNIPVSAATYMVVAAINPTEYVYAKTTSKFLAASIQWIETATIWHCLNFPVYCWIRRES